jgi:hypothetical protein
MPPRPKINRKERQARKEKSKSFLFHKVFAFFARFTVEGFAITA